MGDRHHTNKMPFTLHSYMYNKLKDHLLLHLALFLSFLPLSITQTHSWKHRRSESRKCKRTVELRGLTAVIVHLIMKRSCGDE